MGTGIRRAAREKETVIVVNKEVKKWTFYNG